MKFEKLLFFAGVFLLPAAGIQADTTVQSPKTATESQTVFQNPAEAEKLLKEKAELRQKMLKTRANLLKNDPKLRKLYLDLMRTTRQLAIELNSQPEMRKLNDSLSEVNEKLEKLKKQDNKQK